MVIGNVRLAEHTTLILIQTLGLTTEAELKEFLAHKKCRLVKKIDSTFYTLDFNKHQKNEIYLQELSFGKWHNLAKLYPDKDGSYGTFIV